MKDTIVSVADLKARLSAYLADSRSQRRRIIVTNRRRPIAVITPVSAEVGPWIHRPVWRRWREPGRTFTRSRKASISTSPDHRDQPASADSGYHSRERRGRNRGFTVRSGGAGGSLAGLSRDPGRHRAGLSEPPGRRLPCATSLTPTRFLSWQSPGRQNDSYIGSRSFPTPISSFPPSPCLKSAMVLTDRRTHGNTCSSWSNGYCPASEFWTSTTPPPESGAGFAPIVSGLASR